MKDRAMIIGVIVAIHLIIISLFVITGGDGNDTSSDMPETEEISSEKTELTPDSGLGEGIDIDPDQLRDTLFAELTSDSTDQDTYIVQAGDSLMVISKKFYGSSKHYNYIYEANKDVLKSASSVRSGQKLVIPPAP